MMHLRPFSSSKTPIASTASMSISIRPQHEHAWKLFGEERDTWMVLSFRRSDRPPKQFDLSVGLIVLYVNRILAVLSNCSTLNKLSMIQTMFNRYRESILEALKARGWTRADLARTIRIDFSYLDRLLKGKARFNEDHIEAIAKVLGVAPSGASAPIPVRITYTMKFEDPLLPQKRELDYLPIPIVEPRVAAGNPEVVSSEQVLDIVFIHRRAFKRRSAQGHICTVVKGDSMAPVIRDGATVCIDSRARPEKKVPKDSIWAVRKEDGAVIKHIQFKDDLILLISENPAYEIETTSDPAAIIGRVVGVWQNLA